MIKSGVKSDGKWSNCWGIVGFIERDFDGEVFLIDAKKKENMISFLNLLFSVYRDRQVVIYED